MTGEIQKERLSTRDAKRYLKEVTRSLEQASELPADARQRIESLANDLKTAISEGNNSLMYKRYLALKVLVNEHLELNAKGPLREYGEAIALAVIVALIIRAFVFEAFKIPTGSMIPTLEVGDHLFVNKFIYGIRIPFTDRYLLNFAKPQAGEVVVFTFPNEEAKAYLQQQPHALRGCIDDSSLNDKKDFIKRIVAVEGDTVELRDNRLYVNGTPLKRTRVEEPQKTTESGFMYPIDREREVNNGQVYTVQYAGRDPNFGPVKVSDGHVFVMGDNRDDSADSRCWGQVPVDNIKGRAMFIWGSFGNSSIDFSRFGQSIHETVDH